MNEALFNEHLDWARNIGRLARRQLPPSFDEQDLEQIASIEHWKRVQLYDPSTGVPYRAYAYRAIKGAVLMACRRRSYRDATHEELNGHHVDPKPLPEAVVLAREAMRNVDGPRKYRQRAKVVAALKELPAAQAYVLERVYLDGEDVEALEAIWGVRLGKRLRAAMTKLRKALG